MIAKLDMLGRCEWRSEMRLMIDSFCDYVIFGK